MEEKEKKNSKKKMWQIAFTINFTVVALAIIVALAIMDSDNSESTKSKTVATSTNAVETENEVTKQNYVANSEKRTNEEKSQQTATKDNSTTATTDKKNTSSNSVVEVSDVSMTGMRFNKSWSELKPKLDAYSEAERKTGFAEWLSDQPYGQDITEYTINYKGYMSDYTGNYPYNAFQINFVVENKSDKVVGMYLAVLKKCTEKDQERAFEVWGNILLNFDNSVSERQVEVINKIQSQKQSSFKDLVCYKDNIYAYAIYNNTHTIYFVYACDNEEAQYHKQNGKWRK